MTSRYPRLSGPGLLLSLLLVMSGSLQVDSQAQRLAPAAAEVELLEFLPGAEMPMDNADNRGMLQLTFVALGRRFELEIETATLFVPGSQVVFVGPDGELLRRQPESRLLSGRISGDDGSLVRLISSDVGWEGIIIGEFGGFVLEPAIHYLPGSRPGETVIYPLAGFEEGWAPGSCAAIDALDPLMEVDVQALPQVETPSGSSSSVGPAGHSPGDLQEVELKLFVDSSYFERHGLDSVERVHGIVHAVNGIFERELAVSFRISETRISTSPSTDVVGSTTDSALLLTQLAESQLVGGSDLLHFFTGRDLDRNTLGISLMGSVCNGSHAVTLTQDLPGADARLVTVAHELAHGLGARHDGAGYCKQTERGWIMWPVLDPGARSFSDCSGRLIALTMEHAACVAQISAHPLPAPDVVAPMGETLTSGLQFEWRPVEEARSYELEIQQESGQVVDRIELGETRFPYFGRLALGQIYLWRVTALDHSGSLGTRSSWTRVVPVRWQRRPTRP